MITELHKFIQEMTTEELSEANRAINAEYKSRQFRLAQSFHVGDNVDWDSKKQGEKLFGVITKVNRKTIHVHTEHNGNWFVSPTFLHKIV